MYEWEIIHKSRSREEAQLIKDRVYSTLYEKSQILRQIQVLKKIKDDSILPIIDQLSMA